MKKILKIPTQPKCPIPLMKKTMHVILDYTVLILLTINGKPVCYQPRNPNPVKDSIIAVLILNNVLECVRTLAAKLPSLNKRPASLKE